MVATRAKRLAGKPRGTLECPCGSGHEENACCARLHAGEAAVDAEALMRSRYTAFVQGNETYLLATWHPSTRPERLDLSKDAARWIGLTIRRQEVTGPDTACVEFVARYRINGRAHRLHETSRFVRENGHWLYVDGDIEV